MKQILLMILSVFFTCAALLAQDQKRQNAFNLEKGIAVQGYDVVAYFTQGRAVEGTAANAVYYQGVKYYFSSVANKEEFKKTPAKYEPQYGGWCAYAMGATGEKVEINPETFKILNGKLFLFYNKRFNNTLTKWNKNEAALLKTADVNWGKLFHQ
jgi:YHS domain-containing protein